MRAFEDDTARATQTYASVIAVTNAIKTSIATAVAPVVYSGGNLNGTIGAAVQAVTQLISVTTTTHAATYNIASPIVITGTNAKGATITDSLLLTLANGNETIFSTVAFASVTSIAVPAQADVLGTFVFGVGDIVLVDAIREIRGGAAGNIKVGYQGGFTDTFAALVGERYKVLATRIYASGTTAFPLTVFL